MDIFLAFLKTYAYDPKSNKPLRSTLGITLIIATLIMFSMTISHVMRMNEIGLLYGWMLSQLDRNNIRLIVLMFGIIICIVRVMLLMLQYAPYRLRLLREEQKQNKKEEDEW